MADTHEFGEPDISARLRYQPLTLRYILGVAEAMLGLIAIAFVTGVVIGIGGLIVILNMWLVDKRELPVHDKILRTIAWASFLILQALSIRLYNGAMTDGMHPFPVHIAKGFAPKTLVMRVMGFVWWLGNGFLIVSAFQHLLDEAFEERFAPAVSYVVVGMGVFGAAFACNTYLLIAVHSLTGSEKLVRAVWRFRLLIDLALVLAPFPAAWRVKLFP